MTATTETFAQFLADGGYDGETIIQACRYLTALETDDLPASELRDDLLAHGGSALRIAEALQALATDAELLEQAATATLSMAWLADDGRQTVESAFRAARGKLPVIEVGIAATAVMYGVYLVVTKGIRSERTVTERRADGTTIERRAVEYFGPTGPLNAITNIFRAQPLDPPPPADPPA